MTRRKPLRQSSTGSTRAAWTEFWDASTLRGDHRFRDGRTAARLRAHWDGVFARQFRPGDSVTLLDAACGEGELVRRARSCAAPVADFELSIHCTDIAAAAAAAAARPGPGEPVACPVVADGAALPFPDGSFDCVVSQFGLEYAGPEAFADAARVTSGAGTLHALVHRAGGAIEAECRANLSLLEAIRQAGLLRRLECLVGIAARHAAGRAAPAALERSMAAFLAALEASREAVQCSGEGAARSLVQRLVQDCAMVAGQLDRYAADELEGWLAAHAADLETYAHRMRSMIQAACSEAALAGIVDSLGQGGLQDVAIGEVTTASGAQVLAWSVTASSGRC